MHTLKITAIALVAASISAVSAYAQTQTVRLIINSHLPQATDLGATYTVSCHSAKYALKVSRSEKSVFLSRVDGTNTDLTNTTVGTRLLEDDVLVDVGFNCPHGSINIFLKGVKLVDLSTPTGFHDHINVNENGIVSKGSPRVAGIDRLARPRPDTPLSTPDQASKTRF